MGFGKKNGALNVPSLEDVDGEFAALIARRDDLGRRAQELSAEQSRLYDECKNVSRGRAEQETRVAGLIAGTAPGAQTPGPPGPHERYRDVVRESDDVRRALDEVRRRLADRRTIVSRKICDQLADEHRRRVRIVADALVQLNDAARQYSEFASAMNDRDVAWGSLCPAPPPIGGEPDDRENMIARYLRAAVQDGHLAAADVPGQFK